jgi:hypothetical protein
MKTGAALVIVIVILMGSVLVLYRPPIFAPHNVPTTTTGAATTTLTTVQTTTSIPLPISGSLVLVTTGGVLQSGALTPGAAMKWQLLVAGPIGEAAFSPDRTRLAYTRNDNASGADTIYIFDLATKESKKLLTVEKKDSRVGMIDWSPDSTRIVYLTVGDRHALFLTTMTGNATMLLEASYAYYCPSGGCAPFLGNKHRGWGELTGKWVAKNVLLVQRRMSLPSEWRIYGPGLGSFIIPADRTSFLHLDELPGILVDVPGARRWGLVSAIPPGGQALIYDSNTTSRGLIDWMYLAQSGYFKDLNEDALIGISCVSYGLLCSAPSEDAFGNPEFAAGVSSDGRFLALGRNSHSTTMHQGELLVVLDLTSYRIESLSELAVSRPAPLKQWSTSIEGLTWAPSGVQLAVLSRTSSNLTVSVTDKQTLNGLVLGVFPEPKERLLAFGWISESSLQSSGMSIVDLDRSGNLWVAVGTETQIGWATKGIFPLMLGRDK